MSNRVQLSKGRVGSNILSGYEKTSALVGVFGTISGASGELAVNTPLQFRNLIEAEGFGIADNALLHRQVGEYFRIAGAGASLWLLNLAAPVSYSALVASQAVKDMIIQANGEIFNLGFDYIPASTDYADGLNIEILPAIQAAQALADWCGQTNRPLHIALAGSDYNGTGATALNLRALEVNDTPMQCPQVSLMLGQDYDFAETLPQAQQKYAAVGSLLGAMAKQPVNYNVGEVETMSLTNAPQGLWINAGLSNHQTVKAQEADLDSLNEKGYIFGEYYSGLVVLNDDNVCAPVVVDAQGNMNESTIALSRTNAKIFRELYKIYLPKIKSTVPVDKATGLLMTGMIKYFEGLGNSLFDNMERSQEISGGETVVDPESNLLFGEKSLNVSYNWVPTGGIGVIKGVVNIKRSLQ
jgi:hypothetical protein